MAIDQRHYARVRLVFIVVGIGLGLVLLTRALVLRNDPQRNMMGNTSAPSNMRYLAMEAPCAPSKSAAGMMASAIRDGDSEALQGLLERGKILKLTEGTRFLVDSYEDGFAWGFVRSGRNVGEDCYVIAALLRAPEPEPAIAPGASNYPPSVVQPPLTEEWLNAKPKGK